MTVLLSRQKIPQNNCFILPEDKKLSQNDFFCPEDKKYPTTTFKILGEIFQKQKKNNFKRPL